MHTRTLIANLRDLYKPTLNDAQVRFYAVFLERYTANQLGELWNIVVDNHLRTSPPSIGELKKYANDVSKLKIVNTKDEKAELTEEEVFATELGKLSIAQGWSRSYLLHCRESDIPKQTDEVLMGFQKAKMDAESAAEGIKDNPDPISKALFSMWRTMIAKSKELEQKFKHLIQQ